MNQLKKIAPYALIGIILINFVMSGYTTYRQQLLIRDIPTLVNQQVVAAFNQVLNQVRANQQ